MDTPRRFFDAFVRRSYEEWLQAPTDMLRASCAVHQANVMVERLVQYETRNDNLSPKQFDAKVRKRRRRLATQNSDFALVWDIDDAHKHLELTRKPRKVTRSDQTRIPPIHRLGAIGEMAIGQGTIPGKNIVVVLDDGTRKSLATVLKNVIEMWESILS